jgi:hypothetical protein
VIGRNDYEHDLKYAKQTERDASDWRYYASQAEAGVGNVYCHGDGTQSRYPVSQTEYDRSKEIVDTYKTLDGFLAAKVDERVSEIERKKLDGYYEKLEVLTWCGRLDLAHKQLGQWTRYRDLAIAPVTVL